MITPRHKKFWWSPLHTKLDRAWKERKLGEIAAMCDMVTTTRLEAASFVVPATELLTRNAYRYILGMKK